jgi:hypothetical protein
MWNGPVEVTIEDLFIILGPSVKIVSNDESFEAENESSLLQPYDRNNMYNIFEHQLKIKKKSSNLPSLITPQTLMELRNPRLKQKSMG